MHTSIPPPLSKYSDPLRHDMYIGCTRYDLRLPTLLLFCIVSFFSFDRQLILFLQPFNHGQWQLVWNTITLAGQSEGYLVAGLALQAWFRKKNRITAGAGLFLFSSVAVSGLAVNAFKVILGRARPKLFLQQGIYGFDFFHLHFEHPWTSFPSGHSATALSAAMTLSLLFPRYRLMFMSGALLVATSRVVLCQHYLSDVVAGSMLGVLTTTLLYQRYFRSQLNESRTI